MNVTTSAISRITEFIVKNLKEEIVFRPATHVNV